MCHLPLVGWWNKFIILFQYLVRCIESSCRKMSSPKHLNLKPVSVANHGKTPSFRNLRSPMYPYVYFKVNRGVPVPKSPCLHVSGSIIPIPTPVTSRCEDHVCWLNHQFSMSKITRVNWPPCFNGGRSSSAEQTIGRCRSKERPVGRSGSVQGAEMKHFSGVSQQQTCDLDLSLDQNWAWQACNEQFLPSVKSRVTMTSSKNFPWLTDTSTFPWSLKWGTLITNLQYQ